MTASRSRSGRSRSAGPAAGPSAGPAGRPSAGPPAPPAAPFDGDAPAAANEAAGPAAGDDILREVAAVLAEAVRLVDTVARWGGDEFLLVAPGAAGLIVAQRVLDAV